MRYSQFLKQPNLLKKLLIELEILVRYQQIIEVDMSPDSEVIPTDWRDDDNNYFKNRWDFKRRFTSITEFDFISERVYHFENIDEANSELNMNLNIDDIASCLNQIDHIDPNYFRENGYDTDLNETFHFHKVRVLAIDNIKKCVWYDGSFFGNHEAYTVSDWGVFSKIRLIGIPSFLPNFYQELLGESYLLYTSGNFKLSYFMTYTALENYVNSGLKSDDIEERFKDKLRKWAKTKVTQLEKHEIYCGTIQEYDEFTIKRNTIGHGRESIDIEKSEAESALIFVATLICSFEKNLRTFQDLYDKIG